MGKAQCCMCGTRNMSTKEGDGGPECQLHDGRWTCSRECWDRASGEDPVSAALADLFDRCGNLLTEDQLDARFPDGRSVREMTSTYRAAMASGALRKQEGGTTGAAHKPKKASRIPSRLERAGDDEAAIYVRGLEDANASLTATLQQVLAAMGRIAPYLRWTVGPESPGHHPTMSSAVSDFEKRRENLSAVFAASEEGDRPFCPCVCHVQEGVTHIVACCDGVSGNPNPMSSLPYGRFGKAEDPAEDFRLEVESIKAEAVAFLKNQDAGPTVENALTERIDRAMEFRVGGSESAVFAKHNLRNIVKALHRNDVSLLP